MDRRRIGSRIGKYAIGLCLAAAAGCAEEEPFVFTEAAKPSPLFTDQVYPVLLRDCAFHACHGSGDRLFRIWGPKRSRISDPTLSLSGEPERARIGAEIQGTYEMAIGFIDVKHPEESILLRKGLDPQAGGSGHLGLDRYGRNVYRSGDSPGYVTLSKWVYEMSARAAAAP